MLRCRLTDSQWDVIDQAHLEVDLGDSGTANCLLTYIIFEFSAAATWSA